MKKFRVTAPNNKHWVRAIRGISPSAGSMHDYMPDDAVNRDGWMKGGKQYYMRPGTLVLSCVRGRKTVTAEIVMPKEFGNRPFYELPKSPWSGNLWAREARHYLRSWLALTHSSRVVRVINELEKVCQSDSELHEKLRTMRLDLMGEFSGQSTEDVLNAFRAWVDDVADNISLDGGQILDIIESNLRQRANPISPTPMQLQFDSDDDDDIRPIDLGN